MGLWDPKWDPTQPVDLKDTDCVETFGSRVSF